MKKFYGIAVLALALVATFAYADTQQKSELEALNQARAPIPVAGAPQDSLTISAVSDVSTQLNKNQVYSIVCNTDTHLRWGATAPTAVGTDMFVKSGVMLFFSTDGLQGRYVAGIRDSADGVCQINAWR